MAPNEVLFSKRLSAMELSAVGITRPAAVSPQVPVQQRGPEFRDQTPLRTRLLRLGRRRLLMRSHSPRRTGQQGNRGRYKRHICRTKWRDVLAGYMEVSRCMAVLFTSQERSKSIGHLSKIASMAMRSIRRCSLTHCLGLSPGSLVGIQRHCITPRRPNRRRAFAFWIVRRIVAHGYVTSGRRRQHFRSRTAWNSAKNLRSDLRRSRFPAGRTRSGRSCCGNCRSFPCRTCGRDRPARGASEEAL
jgi:hypothetical protein